MDRNVNRSNLVNLEKQKSASLYPFYVIKSAKSSSRCSSLQSLHQRRAYRLVKRLVQKNGKSSVKTKSNKERSFRFFLDYSNTLLESHWSLVLLILFSAFVVTWFMFAGLWMIVASGNEDGNNNRSCLEGIEGFSGYLLFSVETQSTIGYGSRYVTDACVEAVIILCAQITVGGCICGSLLCAVYLKMVGPKRNWNSVGCFSRKAVICQRDGELCLVFRVRDYHAHYQCHTAISAFLARKRTGELILQSIKLVPPGALLWPVDVVHRIDSSSPLWDVSAKDLLVNKFEIIVFLEGTCLATSSMSRTTTSYLTKEILWGSRFVPCTYYDKAEQKYIVNHKHFNRTEEVDTPLCSAKRLQEVLSDVSSSSNYPKSSSNSTSKYSTPIIVVSPVLGDLRQITSFDENMQEQIGRKVETEALIHSSTAKTKSWIYDHMDDTSSYSEEEFTFMDMSVDNLTENQIPRASNLESNTRRLSVSLPSFNVANKGQQKTERKYEETSF